MSYCGPVSGCEATCARLSPLYPLSVLLVLRILCQYFFFCCLGVKVTTGKRKYVCKKGKKSLQ